MRRISRLFFLMILLTVCQIAIFAQSNLTRLRDVKSIYVDEKSFNFVSSSCMKTYGTQKIVCDKHLKNRAEFLAELKKWIEKYKFNLVSEKDDADAVLQGNLSIDDEYWRQANRERNKNRAKGKANNDSPSIFADGHLPGEPYWTINSWLVNQNGDKLWTKGDWFPEPSYGWSSPAKIEAKKLAREIQYDFEKSK
jgi:hypothetical protein